MNEARSSYPEQAVDGDGFRVVQRTLIRPDQELDVRALYLAGISAFTSSDDASTRQSGGEFSNKSGKEGPVAVEAIRGVIGFGRVDRLGHPRRRGRTARDVRHLLQRLPGQLLAALDRLRVVRLVVRSRGTGTVIVYRSTSKGHVLRAELRTVESDEAQTFVLDLPLKPFIDGGWYWFDVEAADAEIVLE